MTKRPAATRSLFYNRQGEPIDDDEHYRLVAKGGRAYRIVARDQVGDVTVSTVWLGLDHGYGDGLPVIFETALLGPDGTEVGPRYCSEADALTGHAAMVRLVQDEARSSHQRREEPIIPDDDRPIATPEPGSVDISGLDKAELLAVLVNAAGLDRVFRLVTHEQAAAIIQDQLGGAGGRPFCFDYVAGRSVHCDIGGPRISAAHVARYDCDAGEGTMARVVATLRAAYERRRAERAPT